MCGLVGMAGQLTAKEEKAMKTLLILDSLRGTDSTGVAVISRNQEVKVAKAVGNPFELLDTKAYDKALMGANQAIIGHNRYGTMGKISKFTAHPFEFNHIVGAHNGTLTNKHALYQGHSWDVDSQALFFHMNEKSVEDAIHTAAGAWALTWYDKDLNTINLLRNKDRPLWTVTTEDGILFWASERWMLQIALSRNDIKHLDPVEVPEDQWYQIGFDNTGRLEKPVVTPLKSRVPVYVHQNKGGYWANGQWRSTENQTSSTVVGQSVVTQNTSTTPPANNVIPIDKDKVTEQLKGANDYKNGIQVTVEVIGSGMDQRGSSYYLCKDRHKPNNSIRLYVNAKDKVQLMDKFITCSMHAYKYTDRLGVYYKVEHSSVKLVTPSKIEPFDADEKGAPLKENSFQDASGKLIPSSEWAAKHGTCAWCTGHVDPALAFKFTSNGETICHLCVDDKEVAEYVNFR